jgi:transposase
MAPKFVMPYRLSGKRGKNDAADAAAICEAVTRPNMRFVPIKSIDQQGQLLVHRARQGFVEQRTATLNRIRGLLIELGIVLPLKAAVVRREAWPAWKTCPAGPTPSLATCSAKCRGWTSASRSTTSTSHHGPPEHRGQRLMQLPASARPRPPHS